MSINRKQKIVFDYTGSKINKFNPDEPVKLNDGESVFVVSQSDAGNAESYFQRPSFGNEGDVLFGSRDRAADIGIRTRSIRRERGESTGDDGWTYPLVSGCGNYIYNETVRQDKMRVFRIGSSADPYPFHYGFSPFATFGGASGSGDTNSSALFQSQSPSSRLMIGHKDLTGDFYMGFWIYLFGKPSSDQTIIGKLDSVTGFTGPGSGTSGPTGEISGGSGDVFRLWLDGGTDNLYWSFSEEGEASTGLNHTVSLATVGASGGALQTRNWHHVSVNYDSTRGLSEVYIDGSRKATTSISGDGLKRSRYPIFIGANRDGTDGFGGVIKDLIIRGGDSGASTPIAGLTGLNHSATGEQAFTGGVLYYMSMNGKLGCKNFAVETEDYGLGTVTFWDPDYDHLGLRNIQVYGSFTSFHNTQGFIHGLSSGALYLSAATSGGGITFPPIGTVINTTKGRIDGIFTAQTESEFTLTGSSAAAGHFVNLFGVNGPTAATGGDGILGTGDLGPTGNAGTEFSMVASIENYEYVSGIYNIIVGLTGSTGNTNAIPDANNKVFHMFNSQVIGLYDDLTSYFGYARELRDSKKNLANQITDQSKTGTQINGLVFDYQTPTQPKYLFPVRFTT